MNYLILPLIKCLSKSVSQKAKSNAEELMARTLSDISSLESQGNLTEGDRIFFKLAKNHVSEMKRAIDSVETCEIG